MSKISIRFKLRKDRKTKNGNYQIMIVLTKNRKRLFLSLPIEGDDKYWDNDQERFIILKGLRDKDSKELNIERKKNNSLIENHHIYITNIIYDFKRQNQEPTLNQIKEKYLNVGKECKIQIYIEDHIKQLNETDHIGNANTFITTLKIIKKFDVNFHKKLFNDIDIKYVKKFDVWLEKRGCGGNTRMHYHKKLRAIWNMAIKDGEATLSQYPYGRTGFEVGKLEEETEKRYLPTEYLERLKSEEASTPTTEFARNVFLLSYYLYGMSFRDMGLLKFKNIIQLNKGDYIVYKRLKTKNVKNSRSIKIKYTDEIKLIINRLSYNKKPLDDYLLPLVTINKDTESELYSHLSNRRKTVVGWMKELSKEFDIKMNLTSYVSRHTMAMQLQENAISESVISQILGHKNLKTTKTYLDSLDTSVIDEAAKVL